MPTVFPEHVTHDTVVALSTPPSAPAFTPACLQGAETRRHPCLNPQCYRRTFRAVETR